MSVVWIRRSAAPRGFARPEGRSGRNPLHEGKGSHSMGDAGMTHGAPAIERATWLRTNRQENVRQEDDLAPDYDALWGEIDETHRAFVAKFLSLLPPDGKVLDAACGTGKYFPQVI